MVNFPRIIRRKMKFVKILVISFLAVSSVFASCNNEVYGVRGVWLTNVDSEVLNSNENIKEAVALLNELGFNTIFVVTWNKVMTTYPSEVIKNFTGVAIDPLYGNRDPLKELIDEAHKYNIKVIAWFEFGFSSSYKLDGGYLLEKKPEWASKDINGKLVTKNGFDWMNGFNPEVQDFLLSLIHEVVFNYDIDGIQGDDRLPAMPSEAGYDDYTVNLYKQAHNGKTPPNNSKNAEWLTFRSDILSNFQIRLYESVKEIKPTVIVSMAPSVFPWSKDEYLQDWPTWIENNTVDLLCPQVYRYDIDGYKSTLAEMLMYSEGYNSELLAPGVLLNLGEYCASEEFLSEMIIENRKNGINGEVFFFFEGLKKHKDYLKSIYKDKIIFPKMKQGSY